MPITASTVRQVDATTPRIGTTMNIPRMPAIEVALGSPPGRSRVEWDGPPHTSGATMLPVTMLNTSVHTAMTTMSAGPDGDGDQEREAGRDEAADVRDEAQEEGQDEHGQGEREPRTTMITNWLAAPTKEIAPVPIM
jgi:hypothetical protein